MPNPKPDAEFREIRAETIVLRDAHGNVRARVETEPPAGDDERPCTGVRFVLLSPAGHPVVVVEVGGDGRPKITVGPPAGGTAVVVTPDAVECWAGGNAVAALASTARGGALELNDGDGQTVAELPAK